MKELIRTSNKDLSFRLNLNYNNVFSRIRMLLGARGSLFADISTKSSTTTWYTDVDASYTPLSQAPKGWQQPLEEALKKQLMAAHKELSASPELSPYIDDIFEVPSQDYIFYRHTDQGYQFVLAGWGCKFNHSTGAAVQDGVLKRIAKDSVATAALDNEKPAEGGIEDILSRLTDREQAGNRPQNAIGTNPASDGPINTIGNHQPADNLDVKRPTMPPTANKQEPEGKKIVAAAGQKNRERKLQNVMLKVSNQNNKPLAYEDVCVRADGKELNYTTDEAGTVEVGGLPYGSVFSVSFPNLKSKVERQFEVEPGMNVYEIVVKKLKKFTPVMFVEDQYGNSVNNYNVKVIVGGQESVYNTGNDGTIQLPAMQEGQKFVAVDAANYANTAEFDVTSEKAKAPYKFVIKKVVIPNVGITVLDKAGKPISNAVVSIGGSETPSQQMTGEDGRAEFPSKLFTPGDMPVVLNVKGHGQVNSSLKYEPESSEYTVQLKDKKNAAFNWRWMAAPLLLALLLIGGLWTYNQFHASEPTEPPVTAKDSLVADVKTLEKGVVLIYGVGGYYAEVDGFSYNGEPARIFFAWDDEKTEDKLVVNITNSIMDIFKEEKAPKHAWTGTGFLISEDGLIATNRHVADPIVTDEMKTAVKSLFYDLKNYYLQKGDSRTAMVFDKAVQTSNFTIKAQTKIGVAFVDQTIEEYSDFKGCVLRASGDPGGVNEKDVAIIQLKGKKRDVPDDAYVFTVPEQDLMDDPNLPDHYEVTVLGYNWGLQLADIKGGIHPQPQDGKITIKTEKYLIGYNALTLSGSSGAPVYNKDGELVAINNSGYKNVAGYNYGVRTKFLRELLDQVKTKDGSTQNP